MRIKFNLLSFELDTRKRKRKKRKVDKPKRKAPRRFQGSRGFSQDIRNNIYANIIYDFLKWIFLKLVIPYIAWHLFAYKLL